MPRECERCGQMAECSYHVWQTADGAQHSDWLCHPCVPLLYEELQKALDEASWPTGAGV